MQILLTNDDGITAPGLVAMYRRLAELGETHVVAPATVQSATSHGITLTTPLLTSRVKVDDAFTGTSVEGRPADCVKLAMQIMPKKPDLVISGINSGANVGINVLYSGTIAAAIEAAFLGLPAIAMSLHMGNHPPNYPAAANLALSLIRQIHAAGLNPGQVLSVNLPAMPPGVPPKGVKIARQCTRPWPDSYERRTDPRGREYFWVSTVFSLWTIDPDTDVAALSEGFVTITPLEFDLTNHRQMSHWRDVDWKLEP